MDLQERATPYQRRQRHHRTSSLFVGSVLCLFGVLILLQNMGVLRMRDGLAWAVPIAAMAWGIYTLIRVKTPFGLAMGAIGIVFGVLRILHLGGVIEFDRKYIPPMVLIGIGGAFLIRALSPVRDSRPTESSDNTIVHHVMFGGVERRIETPDFRGGELFVTFGAIDLDMRKSKIPPGQTVTIDCNVMFGGLELKVPEDWRVDVRTMNVFGGVDDKSVTSAGRTDLPVLVLTGSIVFGGAEIRN